MSDQSAPTGKTRYGLRDILNLYPRVREDHLRYLAKWGLIQPIAGASFVFSDRAVIRQVQAELERDVPFRAIVRALNAAREGQLSLDFRADDPQPARIIAWERPAHPSSIGDGGARVQPQADRGAAAEAFLEAFMLDDGDPDKQNAALAAYRDALAINPALVPALVNLANIHYAREERVEAQALYERAVRLEPHCYEAHFNLGHVFHDLGRFDEAQACYRQTIAISPAYPEAHFYLAVTLEKMGRSQDAKPHWRTYQQLAPDGEWVELAKEFSE